MPSLFRRTLFMAALAAAGANGPSLAQTVALDPIQVERLGIQLGKVEPAETVSVASLAATVVRARSDTFTLTTPFAGTVTKLGVAPGQHIKAGDLVAVIESQDFSETRARLSEARAQARAAEQSLVRQQQLVEAGVGARTDLEAAEARAASAQATVRDLAARMPDNIQTSSSGTTQINVRTFADGRVDSVQAGVGETVNALSPLAFLSAEGRLWAEIQVPARLLGSISVGDTVRYESGGTGAIVVNPETIDPMTRSASAYAEIPADFNAYQGALIRVQLEKTYEEAGVMSVPSAAVVAIEDKTYVFREDEGGFDAVEVEVANRTSDVALVSGALRAGDRVAIRGLSELKMLAIEEIG
ncbi:efflux RND transporter periplasmic adaptor subunit [Henriciella sp.]|uniref:efflux RND transporter periplasmic adaptor subunit n=1 Tax=Henriciella sp. TaxID=1968823 RepID=UPI0026260321|nr:efflux RND transporter periplasmic adaptor subunit [Henriciella sp.]